jgi:flap endonuclease-1
LLGDSAPGCMKEQKFENYFGRKIAVDASMHIYSFLVVVGRTGDQLLTSETGEITSHLLGMFFRTTRMLEAGIKPIFVFEGSAPDLKRQELAKRSTRREGANQDLEAARDAGDQEAIE